MPHTNIDHAGVSRIVKQPNSLLSLNLIEFDRNKILQTLKNIFIHVCRSINNVSIN